jgi:holo-[acyl-carrier protein] synthase
MTHETLRRRAITAEHDRRRSGPEVTNTRAGKRRTRTDPSADSAGPLASIPVRAGIDIVRLADVSAALNRFADRYVERVFTRREAAYCLAASTPVAAARFAARFAAKEAAVKALQPEHQWTDWRAIEVRRGKSGRCTLVLHREAASLAARRGIVHLALSMTHEGDLAAAVVVALRTTRIQKRERRHASSDHC